MADAYDAWLRRADAVCYMTYDQGVGRVNASKFGSAMTNFDLFESADPRSVPRFSHAVGYLAKPNERGLSIPARAMVLHFAIHGGIATLGSTAYSPEPRMSAVGPIPFHHCMYVSIVRIAPCRSELSDACCRPFGARETGVTCALPILLFLKWQR